MRLEVSVVVDAPKSEVWKLIADIEGSPRRIKSIEKIEILERPPHGLMGLKWKETRLLHGKTHTETMWVTAVDPGSSYVVEANTRDMKYRTQVYVAEEAGGTRLGMVFEITPKTSGAKFMLKVIGFVIKGFTRKALTGDLKDIKRAAESR